MEKMPRPLPGEDLVFYLPLPIQNPALRAASHWPLVKWLLWEEALWNPWQIESSTAQPFGNGTASAMFRHGTSFLLILTDFA
jgi:hypothetical protein